MLVDTHVHVSSPDTGRFPTVPLPDGEPPWWVDPMPLTRMLGEMDRCGVDRVVLVHAFGAYGGDNRYVVSVATEATGRARTVYGIEPATPGSLAAVPLPGTVPGVRGVRVRALSTDPAGDPWLDDGRVGAVWAAAAGLGVPVVVCARARGLERLLPHVTAHPAVPVVVDDCGVPELDGDRIPANHPVFAYADLGHVAVKVFSPRLIEAASHGSARRLVDQVVGAFGAGRVAWGSNFPQSGIDYATLVGAGRDAVASLPLSDAAAVLGATALGLWFGAAAA